MHQAPQKNCWIMIELDLTKLRPYLGHLDIHSYIADTKCSSVKISYKQDSSLLHSLIEEHASVIKKVDPSVGEHDQTFALLPKFNAFSKIAVEISKSQFQDATLKGRLLSVIEEIKLHYQEPSPETLKSTPRWSGKHVSLACDSGEEKTSEDETPSLGI